MGPGGQSARGGFAGPGENAPAYGAWHSASRLAAAGTALCAGSAGVGIWRHGCAGFGTAFADNPALVANYSSASSMWTANAATVTPGADSADGRVHFTPANLTAMPHRALEDRQTQRRLIDDIRGRGSFRRPRAAGAYAFAGR